MRIGTAGVVTNEYNHILLIQRDDTRSWCEPGGSLEFGTLPTDNVAKEVREETGMIVMPVRLVALHYWAIGPDGGLGFIFRCLIRGGELTTSEESLQVGFFPDGQLPRPILNFHQQAIDDGWYHKGGPPIFRKRTPTISNILMRLFLLTFVYPFKNLRRRLQGKDPYTPPPTWQTTIAVVAHDDSGRACWVEQDGQSTLPHGRANSYAETPWETAARLIKEQTGQQTAVTHLPLVVVKKESAEITLVFSATLPADSPHLKETPPENADGRHLSFLKDVLNNQEETIFRYDA